MHARTKQRRLTCYDANYVWAKSSRLAVNNNGDQFASKKLSFKDNCQDKTLKLSKCFPRLTFYSI